MKKATAPRLSVTRRTSAGAAALRHFRAGIRRSVRYSQRRPLKNFMDILPSRSYLIQATKVINVLYRIKRSSLVS